MLVISTQNWSILAKFAKKNPAKSAVFYWLFLGEVPTRFFRELWLFSREIGQFFREFALENLAKFFFFFHEISEALCIYAS